MSLGKYLIGVPRGGFKSRMKRVWVVTGDTGGADAGAGAGAGRCAGGSPTCNPLSTHLSIILKLIEMFYMQVLKI